MSRFESMMQGVVEGSFGRVFRSRLQPVELVSKLTRAMESNLQIGPERRIAPNVYQIYLSRRDLEYFEKFKHSLKQQLADALIAVARARGYMLLSVPVLHFQEEDGLITGETHITTQVLDPRLAQLDGEQVSDAGMVDETRAMSPGQAQALVRQSQTPQAGAEPLPPAWLTLLQRVRGSRLLITKLVLHVGRHMTN